MITTGLGVIGLGEIVMILVGLVFVFLGIKFKMEPLLLIPIGFSAILVNLPLSGIVDAEEGGIIYWIFHELIQTEVIPCLIFFCLGTMTDFGPLISNPKTFVIGAAAQLGVVVAFVLAILLNFEPATAAAIGLIGGADGPTSIFIANKLAPTHLLGPISVAAYSYMALVPIIQPPVILALTSKEERMIRMENIRPVRREEKIIFPIAIALISGLLVPRTVPLIGLMMFGNLLRECGVTERLSKTGQNEFINMLTILLGLGIGGKMIAGEFLTTSAIKIIVLGIVAFVASTAGGVIMVKFMNLFMKKKINPVIGAAGVSAVPMAARVAQNVASKEDKQNFLLMQAMGPNVAGVIGTATIAGLFIQFFI